MPLGQPVNPVVDQQNIYIKITSQEVDQVVSADTEAVAVAGDHPDAQVGIGQLDAGGHGGSPAVDGMKAVGIHIVGEPAGTTDTGDEYYLLLGMPQLREGFLHLCQDGIIAAARAPAYDLVRDEILAFKRGLFDFSRINRHFIFLPKFELFSLRSRWERTASRSLC